MWPGQVHACYRFSVVQVLIVFHAGANSSTNMLMHITYTHTVHHQCHTSNHQSTVSCLHLHSSLTLHREAHALHICTSLAFYRSFIFLCANVQAPPPSERGTGFTCASLCCGRSEINIYTAPLSYSSIVVCIYCMVPNFQGA